MTHMEPNEKTAWEDLYKVLRNVRPDSVDVVDVEGDRRSIEARKGKGRWENVCDAVVSMLDEIERVEMMAEDGKLRRTWKPPAQSKRAPDAEEVPADLEGIKVPLSFVLAIQRMTQQSAEDSVKRHMAGQSAVMTQLLESLKLQADQARDLMKAHSGMLRLAYQATVARGMAEGALQQAAAAAQNGDDPADDVMVTMLRKILGVPPGGVGAFLGDGETPEEKPAPNGAGGDDPH